MQTYNIKLQQFEGPFDLLLFFIERDELDINDIPISKITQDFLDYIQHLEQMNIDVASEFILVAATLMKIKARMLLPRKELDELGQEIDPREELVSKLIEYRKFKAMVEDFRFLEEVQSSRVTRGNLVDELKSAAVKALVDVELESLSLFKLLHAFQRVMDDFNTRKKIVHRIVRYEYNIEDQQEYIRQVITLRQGERASFQDVFASCENRIHAIITFLALLEMINQQQVHIVGGNEVNQFWLSVPEPQASEESVPEGV